MLSKQDPNQYLACSQRYHFLEEYYFNFAEVRRILSMLYQSVVENDPWSHDLMKKHQDLLDTDITIGNLHNNII